METTENSKIIIACRTCNYSNIKGVDLIGKLSRKMVVTCPKCQNKTIEFYIAESWIPGDQLPYRPREVSHDVIAELTAKKSILLGEIELFAVQVESLRSEQNHLSTHKTNVLNEINKAGNLLGVLQERLRELQQEIEINTNRCAVTDAEIESLNLRKIQIQDEMVQLQASVAALKHKHKATPVVPPPNQIDELDRLLGGSL
jgi:predicted nucleic-acid-binding Zn-ribbon protein